MEDKREANAVIYKTCLKKYTEECKNSLVKYYNNMLQEKTVSLRDIYGVVDKLTGSSKAKVLPNGSTDTLLAEKIKNYFVEKIDQLRSDISREHTSTGLFGDVCPLQSETCHPSRNLK